MITCCTPRKQLGKVRSERGERSPDLLVLIPYTQKEETRRLPLSAVRAGVICRIPISHQSIHISRKSLIIWDIRYFQDVIAVANHAILKHSFHRRAFFQSENCTDLHYDGRRGENNNYYCQTTPKYFSKNDFNFSITVFFFSCRVIVISCVIKALK